MKYELYCIWIAHIYLAQNVEVFLRQANQFIAKETLLLLISCKTH